MKTNYSLRPAVISAGIAALCMILVISSSSPASAQDSKTGKSGSTSSAPQKSKVKKSESVTVTAMDAMNGKEGKYRILIIKDEDGKKTKIDTVFYTNDKVDSKEIDKLMEAMHVRVGDMDERLKDLQVFISTDNDSSMIDSTGHHKFIYKFNGNGCCPNGWAKAGPHAFRYNFELPDVPEPPDFPDGFAGEYFNQWTPGPRVIAMPNKGQSLSDVLGDIPMSRVKAYKIIDKKGGKRIVIDVEDGPSFDGGSQVIIMDGSSRHTMRAPRGHQKNMEVIINTGDDDEKSAPKTEQPAPASEPKKDQTN